MNNFNYDDYCRIIGDIYLNAQAQKVQVQQLLDKMNDKIANLEKENRRLKEQCNIQTENI